MTKIRLHLEALDARIVPDATPLTPLSPPAATSPPGLDYQAIIEELRLEYQAAVATVEASLDAVYLQYNFVIQDRLAVVAATNALANANAADRPVLTVALDAAIARAADSFSTFTDFVYQYRADRQHAMSLLQRLSQFEPNNNLEYPPILARDLDSLVTASGNPGQVIY